MLHGKRVGYKARLTGAVKATLVSRDNTAKPTQRILLTVLAMKPLL